MKISAACIATASLALLLAIPSLTAESGDQAATPSPSLSKVRIVRLSEVKGEVQMDRAVGRGFEPAIANLPIVENSRLQTQTGVAEVEFEDNSSLRLAPNSEVQFDTLERQASGGTISSVRVLKGMAYVSLMKTPANQFNLIFGQQTIQLPPASHVRLQLEGSDAHLAVLGGDVQIKGPEGLEQVPHKRTITFPMAGPEQPMVAKKIVENPFDTWDHNATDYHDKRANVSALNSSPYAYGLSDMMYYGDFANAGGCGMMWRPYFASAAWDPYSNGSWAWYGSGMGYSWVSPYPWGWMPYHYGAWSFCPGTGWGWMPGGSWMGLNNTAGFASLRGPITRPRMPMQPPRPGRPGLLTINQRPLVRSEVNSPSSFMFRKDSAGMGVPRNELGKLNRFSNRAISRGTATTPVYMQVPVATGANGRVAFSGVPAMHRGSPAPASMGSGEMGGPGRMSGPAGQPGNRGSGPSMGGPPASRPSMSSPSMSRPSMPSGGAGGGHPSAPSAGGGRR